MQIAVENSTWNNVGDGFYQFAIYEFFRQKLPNVSVTMFDGPVTRAFRPRFLEQNALDSRRLIDSDIVVFSGPILNSRFLVDYAPIIERTLGKGKKYMILSTHYRPSSGVANELLRFFEKCPPLAVSTRDRPTFQTLSAINCPLIEGVCFAFFCGELLQVSRMLNSKKPIILSFYQRPEPSIEFKAGSDGELLWALSANASKKLVPYRISRHFEWLAGRPATAFGWEIIRCQHGLSRLEHILFRAPNSYVSYNPLNYLSLYAGAEAVFTDRVHACVAALAFGRPAVFFGDTPRSSLLDRDWIRRSSDGRTLIADRAAIKGEMAFVARELDAATGLGLSLA